MKYKILLFSGLAIMFALTASASTDPGTGADDINKIDIVGGVFHNDSKKPIGNVTVKVYSASNKEKAVITDKNGTYTFNDLKPGSYKFVFEKDGYKKVTMEKTITKVSEAGQLNIKMEQHSTFDYMPGPTHFFDFK